MRVLSLSNGQVEVSAHSPEGLAFFAKHFGAGACGCTMDDQKEVDRLWSAWKAYTPTPEELAPFRVEG
jgi:ferredoxin-thioredoxin reductase catalytic subunit